MMSLLLSIALGIFLAVMLLGFMVELKTGGSGLGALPALGGALLFWGVELYTGAVDLATAAIFAGGVLALMVELLCPTIGLLAGAGIIAMVYSVLHAVGSNVAVIASLLISLGAAVNIFLLLGKHFPKSRWGERLRLRERLTSAKGFVSVKPRPELVGRRGRVTADLRPSGTAEIDGRPVDVVSKGRFLPRGTEIVVQAVEGMRVVVVPAEEQESSPAAEGPAAAPAEKGKQETKQ